MLNDECLTFIRSGGTPSALNLTMASRNTWFVWFIVPYTSGSDHVHIPLTPPYRGTKKRIWQEVKLWDDFRSTISASESDTLLDNILTSLQKPTRIIAVPVHVVVPDMKYLHLRAALPRAQRHAGRTVCCIDWKAYNRV